MGVEAGMAMEVEERMAMKAGMAMDVEERVVGVALGVEAKVVVRLKLVGTTACYLQASRL